MNVALLIFTDGRKSLLRDTIKSAEANLVCDFKYRIIINDCQDAMFKQWLNNTYVDYDIHHNHIKRGFAGAIIKGWDVLPEDVDYIFHLEEDFTFNELINVYEMIDMLKADHKMAQMSLKRQRWGDEKIGFIEDNIEHYYQFNNYVIHKQFFTTNPSVYPARITIYGWDDIKHSERAFGEKIFADGLHCGILGYKFGAPKVHHTGKERPKFGKGY